MAWGSHREFRPPSNTSDIRIKSEGGRKVVALDCSSPHWNQVIFMDGRLSFRGRRIDSGCLHGLFAQWSTVGNLFWLWALLLVISGAKTHLKLNFGDNVKTEFAILTKKCYEKTPSMGFSKCFKIIISNLAWALTPWPSIAMLAVASALHKHLYVSVVCCNVGWSVEREEEENDIPIAAITDYAFALASKWPCIK